MSKIPAERQPQSKNDLEGGDEKELKEGEEKYIAGMQDNEDLGKSLHTVLLKEYEIAISEIINIIKRQNLDELMHERLKTKKYDASTWHLPLTIAALKYNKYMIKCLIDEHVQINNKCEEERGDNVLHSLVRHAAKNPQEMDKITDIFTYLIRIESKDIKGKPAWQDKNHQGLTVFNLATTKGVMEIVSLIIEEQNEICRKQDNDETKAFLEYHDITQIDYVANKIVHIDPVNTPTKSGVQSVDSKTKVEIKGIKTPTQSGDQNVISSVQGDNDGAKSKLNWFCKNWRSNIDGYTDSLIELLFSNSISNDQACAFLRIKTVRIVFEERFKLCLIVLLICAVLHFVVMAVVTNYAIAHADLTSDRSLTYNRSDVSLSDANTGYMGFVIAMGVVYFTVTLLAISHKIFRPRRRKHWKHNIIYITLLLVFACCTLFHAVNEDARTYCLIIALITGWSFMLFFLTPLKYFSFFTEMLQRVFLKNFASFSIVLALHLISFSTAMYVMMKPRSPDITYPEVLFTMFQLMIGLSEIENIQETQNPYFSYCLYIIFVLLTYIFLLNALIGMMSETCVSLAGDAKLDQWRIQMLSVMLFFDDTLLLFFRNTVWTKIYRRENKYIVKKELYVVLKSEKIATKDEPNAQNLKEQSDKKDSESRNKSENSDHHLVDKTIPNGKCEPPNESDILVQHSFDDVVPNDTNGNTEIYLLPRYVLTDKHGHPLATILVHNTGDSDVSFNHNGLNVIDVETHSPGVIMLDDSEKNRRLSIHIEEYKSDKYKEQSKDKFYEIDEGQEGIEGKRDVLNEDSTKTISKEIENDFLLARYVLTNRSGQPIASVYVHESQAPCISDCHTFKNVIDVDAHSPGLIILDDPENGRSLNIRIKQQMIVTAHDKILKNEKQQTSPLSGGNTTYHEGSYSRSEGNTDVTKMRHTSTSSKEASIESNPTKEEKRGDNAETNYILIDKSGYPLASVLVHGPEDTGILNDRSVCNVIDLETNSSAVILFENREQGLRLNVQIEGETSTNVGHKQKVKRKKKRKMKTKGIADN